MLLALDIVYAPSSIGLVQQLSKIPIKRFLYKRSTNAAFNHVMAQSVDFHSTQDSAEVMEAIEQGRILGDDFE
ncbi:ATPase [Ascochyta rabiei]|uniref:ATPase n=1 Tax=Didymella rabiei TaxID=5454 RepID=A0A163GPV2_DIDRA|nr:ATPase [Ascochyta rabiei]